VTALEGALLSTLVGVPFGVAASFAAWYIVSRWIVPAITFSDRISKLPPLGPNVGCRYRIKFKNVGRRGVIDVDISTRLRIRCLSGHPEFSKTWTIVTLATDTMHEPRIPKGANRVVVLDLDGTLELSSPMIVSALHGRAPTLESLLSLGDEAELVVWVLAFDEYSGARRAFASKKYRLEDVSPGKYCGADSLELLPLEPQPPGHLESA
jgi:hypothetical protein